MSLIKCLECAKEISDKAVTCPSCGAPRSVAPTHQRDPSNATVFREPATGKTVNIANAGLWTLLFGCFYFLLRGVYTHALISAGAAIITAGISWLIYPFFAQNIVRNHMVRERWVAAAGPSRPVDRSRDKWIWLFFIVFFVFIMFAATVNR